MSAETLHAMATPGVATQTHDEHHHDAGGNAIFGFWIYLMNDCILFATLFATYAVLSGSIADGPSAKQIFELPYVLVETICLLLSSVTYGFAMLAYYRQRVAAVQGWLAITFLFGLAFVGMEINEFAHLIHEGYGPDRSAFLSAFFALVATHGLHVTFGLIWMVVLMLQIRQKGLTEKNGTRLLCLSLFWHFLDIVWICVFSFVYLASVI